MNMTRRAACGGGVLFLAATSSGMLRAQPANATYTGNVPERLRAERELVAQACRMLGKFDLVRGSSGHVSMRTGPDRMLLRCREPGMTGLLFTTADTVREVDLNGKFVEDAPSFQTPTELPIHAEIYRSRPDVRGIVHAHATAVVTALAAGLTLKPVVGSYNSPSARLATRGFPIYPLSTRITTREEGQDLARIMGDAPVCLLKGHGIASAATSVEVAVLQAMAVEDLAKMNLEIAKTGATPTSISESEMEEFRQMDRVDDGRSDWNWRYYVRLMGE